MLRRYEPPPLPAIPPTRQARYSRLYFSARDLTASGTVPYRLAEEV
ncbi:hypothetical protein ACFY3V_33605 [Streptosporangium sp. NPDC000095]